MAVGKGVEQRRPGPAIPAREAHHLIQHGGQILAWDSGLNLGYTTDMPYLRGPIKYQPSAHAATAKTSTARRTSECVEVDVHFNGE
jgi:hypothetical protein